MSKRRVIGTNKASIILNLKWPKPQVLHTIMYYLLMLQEGPLQPGPHWHSKPWLVSTQLPPLKQGSDRQACSAMDRETEQEVDWAGKRERDGSEKGEKERGERGKVENRWRVKLLNSVSSHTAWGWGGFFPSLLSVPSSFLWPSMATASGVESPFDLSLTSSGPHRKTRSERVRQTREGEIGKDKGAECKRNKQNKRKNYISSLRKRQPDKE